MTTEEKKARAEERAKEKAELESRFPGVHYSATDLDGNFVGIHVEPGATHTLMVQIGDKRHYLVLADLERFAELLSALIIRYNAMVEHLNALPMTMRTIQSANAEKPQPANES